MRWHHGSESVEQLSDDHSTEQRPMCPGSFLYWHHSEDKNNLHGMGLQTSQTWKSQSSESLVIVVAKVMLPAPRGTCWGAAVGQSFLLEMYVRCLTWSRHWWYSSDVGEEYSCVEIQDSAQTSYGKPLALSFLSQSALLRVICTHSMWHTCAVCMN